MFLLSREPGNADLAVALNFIGAKRFEEHLAHLATDLLACCDHWSQVFDLLARVWVLHHGGDRHLEDRDCLIGKMHLVGPAVLRSNRWQ